MNDMLSRVADSLYWMSRYLERTENTARMVDVHLNFMLDSAPGVITQRRLNRLLAGLTISLEDNGSQEEVLRRLTFDTELTGSIIHSLTMARENARNIREFMSSEMWMQINRLYLFAKQANETEVWQSVPHQYYVFIKEGSHLFQGITDSTMNHNQGWHFIQIGRYLERILALLAFLDAQIKQRNRQFETAVTANPYFEMVALLKSVTAFEAYCKVFDPTMHPDRIVQFLIFNNEFPRSVRFCSEQVYHSLNELADATLRHKNQRVNRLAGRLQSMLNYDDLNDLLDEGFSNYIERVRITVYQIHEALFDAYITYSVESMLK